jgi:cell division protein FtsW (lipid II flippase)
LIIVPLAQFHLENRKFLEQYAKYSTVGFQVVVFLGLFIWIGYAIDQKMENKRLWATLIFSLLACVMIMIYLIYKLGNVSKKSHNSGDKKIPSNE